MTRSSSFSLASRVSIITAMVVASTLVSDERSNTVSSFISRGCGTQRAKSEASLENHVGAEAHHCGSSGEDAALDGVVERLLYFTPSQARNLRMIIG